MNNTTNNSLSFLPASTHRNYIRVPATSSPAFLSILNPWGVAASSSTSEKMVLLESEKLLKRTCSMSLESEDDIGEDMAVEMAAPQISISHTNPTSRWIDEQIALSDAVVEKELEEPQITLFQGFKALHPKLALRKSDSNSSLSSSIKVAVPVLAPSIAAPSTKSSSRFPAKARHQAVAINNIAKLFSDLLKEREHLARQAENVEAERSCFEDELRQIEDILTTFAAKKRDTIEKINGLIKKEDRLAESIESLDERICSIGDHTVGVEKRIRTIKADSSLTLIEEKQDEEEEEARNSVACIKTYFGHLDSVECVDFESSFGTLITGSADKTLRIWDMSTHQCKGVLEGHEGWIRAVQLCGYQAVSGSGDQTAKLWDLSRLEQTGSPLLDGQDDIDDPLVKSFYGHSGGITCLQFEQGRLLTGSVDKTIRNFDTETGVTLSVLYAYKPLDSSRLDPILYPRKQHETDSNNTTSDLFSDPDFIGWDETHAAKAATTAASFSNCGHVGGLHFYHHALAAGYGDGQIRLFDLRTGKCHRQLIEHSMAVTTVTFDDNEIISGSLDKTIKVWDLRMGQTSHTMTTRGNITDLSFDSLRIAVASSCKSVLVYSRTGAESNHYLELAGHSKICRSVKLASTGGRLVSGGLDHSVRLWNLGGGGI